jgi:hypothetical protein
MKYILNNRQTNRKGEKIFSKIDRLAKRKYRQKEKQKTVRGI